MTGSVGDLDYEEFSGGTEAETGYEQCTKVQKLSKFISAMASSWTQFIAISVAILAAIVSSASFFVLSRPQGEVLDYHGCGGWARESVRWDDRGQRFLLTDMSNGITQVYICTQPQNCRSRFAN